MEEINSRNLDYLLISGDISNAYDLFKHLEILNASSARDIYFVLGNHDFYGSSIEEVRSLTSSFCQKNPKFHYLTELDVTPISDQCALIGHDGWADAQEGDFFSSPVRLRDYIEIKDLSNLLPSELYLKLKALGEQAANQIKDRLLKALQEFQEVIILTHAPPYLEACLYNNEVSNSMWTPHFVCKSVGEVVSEIMSQYPDRKVLVLCGHSHHYAEYSPLPNIQVLTGESVYGYPILQSVLKK